MPCSKQRFPKIHSLDGRGMPTAAGACGQDHLSLVGEEMVEIAIHDAARDFYNVQKHSGRHKVWMLSGYL